MDQIKAILSRKGGDLLSTASTVMVIDAVRQMAEAGVGSILIMDDGELVGIFTERDYLRRIAIKGRRSTETVMSEVMTGDLVTVSPDHTVEHCMGLMTDRRIRHLPVLADGAVVGVVSIGDLVRQVMLQQAERIRHLTDYVSGGYPR